MDKVQKASDSEDSLPGLRCAQDWRLWTDQTNEEDNSCNTNGTSELHFDCRSRPILDLLLVW
jgi:hypothetical protein